MRKVMCSYLKVNGFTKSDSSQVRFGVCLREHRMAIDDGINTKAMKRHHYAALVER